MSTACANCSAPLGTPYCGQCGQHAVHGRLSLHDIAHDAWHAIAHLDSGLVRLVRGLATHPGRVYAEYLAGARKRYFNPVLFLLLVEGAYIALGTVVLKRQLALTGRTGQLVAEAAVLQADKLKVLLGLPLLVLLSWLLARPRYTAAEITVFWLFCLGFVTGIAELVGLPLQWLVPAQRETIKYIFGWVGGLLLAWHVFAFFGAARVGAVLRSVAIVLLSLPVLNYAYRLIYRAYGFDVPLGLVATLRDTFGL
ncbi:MAG: DUF3667 domain-containing protein [Gemmatimonadaceae bacterium]|jgi:hypothetical protein|nr:DUF3667 domain-containing protein [Gemmatimonadaceae bacterium]